MDARTEGGGEAVNTRSRRGRQIDGKHAYRSDGEKSWMYTAGREQVRETQQMHTAGGKMHRIGRGSSTSEVSRKLRNKMIRNHKIHYLNIYCYLIQEINRL